MSDVKRWDCYGKDDLGYPYPALTAENVQGDWVRFEDYDAKCAELAEADKTIAGTREVLAAYTSENVVVMAQRAIEDRDALRAEVERLRGALAELVACKELHDRVESDLDLAMYSDATAAAGREYDRRKPLAWAQARAALAADQPAACPECDAPPDFHEITCSRRPKRAASQTAEGK